MAQTRISVGDLSRFVRAKALKMVPGLLDAMVQEAREQGNADGTLGVHDIERAVSWRRQRTAVGAAKRLRRVVWLLLQRAHPVHVDPVLCMVDNGLTGVRESRRLRVEDPLTNTSGPTIRECCGLVRPCRLVTQADDAGSPLQGTLRDVAWMYRTRPHRDAWIRLIKAAVVCVEAGTVAVIGCDLAPCVLCASVCLWCGSPDSPDACASTMRVCLILGCGR